jgi:hypothetical protein
MWSFTSMAWCLSQCQLYIITCHVSAWRIASQFLISQHMSIIWSISPTQCNRSLASIICNRFCLWVNRTTDTATLISNTGVWNISPTRTGSELVTIYCNPSSPLWETERKPLIVGTPHKHWPLSQSSAPLNLSTGKSQHSNFISLYFFKPN